MGKIVINTTPLLSPHTGIARYIYHLSKALASEYLEYRFEYFEGLAFTDALREMHSGRVTAVKDGIVKKVPFSRYFIKKLQKFSFERGLRTKVVDLYHEPNYLPISYKYPNVITVHDLSFIRYPETHPRDRVRILERKLPEALNRSGAILVDSHFVRQELLEYFDVDDAKVVVHHLAVGDAYRVRDPGDAKPTLQRYGLKHKQYFLAVGTLEPRKNLIQAIDAYRNLPDQQQEKYPMVVIGAKGWGEGIGGKDVARLISRGRLIMPGYVDDRTLAEIYSGARVFLYPSLYEGFGLPPLEAMSSGVPVIVTDRASLPEVVGEAGIKVGVGDVDSTTDWMQKLLLDESLYNERRQGCLQQAGRFSWKECARVTMQAYQMVMNTR